MKHLVMTVIFEDGTVDLCKVNMRSLGWMDVFPLEGNLIITSDFKTVCDSALELIDEIRHNYPHAEYITVKPWKEDELNE